MHRRIVAYVTRLAVTVALAAAGVLAAAAEAGAKPAVPHVDLAPYVAPVGDWLFTLGVAAAGAAVLAGALIVSRRRGAGAREGSGRRPTVAALPPRPGEEDHIGRRAA